MWDVKLSPGGQCQNSLFRDAGKNTHGTMPHPLLSQVSEPMKVAVERAQEVPRSRQDSNPTMSASSTLGVHTTN